MDKKLFGKIVLTSALAVATGFMFKVNISAVNATANFVDSRSRSVTMQCPGSYEVYKTDGPHDMDSACLSQHIAGCCDGSGAYCKHFGEWNGSPSRSDIYGTLEIKTGHHCDAQGDTGCTRARKTWTRCNVCGAEGLNGSDSSINVNNACAHNSGKGHYIQASADGIARCIYCGGNAGSTNLGGKCNRQTSQSRNVSWKTTINYNKSDGTAASDSPNGSGNVQYIIQYGSKPVVQTSVTSTYYQGNIVGYSIIENGVESGVVGDTNANSTRAYSAVTYNKEIKFYTTVQFHIYTNAGDYYLPQVTLIPGVVISYDGNKETVNKYGDAVTTLPVGDMGLQVIEYGKTGQIKDNISSGTDKAYTKEGYTFVTWNLAQDGSKEQFDPGRTVSYDYIYNTYGPVITLYAQWEPITYSLEDPKSGSANGSGYNGNHSTTVEGSGDYDSSTRMPSKVIDKDGKEITTIRFDQPVKLLKNKYIRQYYVTLMNNEQWLEHANSGKNSASAWVPYKFRGWSLKESQGVAPYYVDETTEVKTASTYDKAVDLNKNPEYYVSDECWVKNMTHVKDEKVEFYAVWASNTIKLPSTVTGHTWTDSSKSVFIDWSDKDYVDNRIYDREVVNNKDENDYTVKKGTEYKPSRDITLFGHWYRELKLNFDLTGGKDKYKNTSFYTLGTLYDYYTPYTFGVVNNITNYENGKNSVQTTKKVAIKGTQTEMPLEIYGTWDSNGVNTKYTKVDKQGVIYRFLGWTTDATSKEPDADLIVYDTNHSKKYSIKDNTTLYAVWEPVLQLNARVGRTLGEIKDSNNTLIQESYNNLTAVTSNALVECILRPGEQGQYTFTTKNRGVEATVKFSEAITDIYDHAGDWTDDLNKPTAENLVTGQKHGLNRKLTLNEDVTTRQFNVPQYLGTDKSYESSKNKHSYDAVFTFKQSSYYYKYVHNTDEIATLKATLFIKQNTSDDPTEDPKDLPSIIEDLNTRIKIRIKN